MAIAQVLAIMLDKVAGAGDSRSSGLPTGQLLAQASALNLLGVKANIAHGRNSKRAALSGLYSPVPVKRACWLFIRTLTANLIF
jgi:hypothetical protein